LTKRLEDFRERWNREVEPWRARLGEYSEHLRRLGLDLLAADYRAARAPDYGEKARLEAVAAALRAEEEETRRESEACLAGLESAQAAFREEKAYLFEAGGREAVLPLSSLADVIWPNQLTLMGKLRVFAGNFWDLLIQYPREANTDGGIFPALFGTVMLVFLMAVSAFPLGVAAGVYLREYARDSFLSRLARVAVNNLAGVPSIVYGIFGLGFFVYGLGGALDRLLYPERVAAGVSTYGGGGILWSSLTLGFLTLPVVIVATEEALSTVPAEIRQGSLALGATRFQTLWRVALPMASPGILTGFILAMARAAGEVAPLMITGVVKSMQSLPLDGYWPYLHLDRKFMHLGFHIYDLGFQSPNAEAAKPMVYLTALILLVLVFFLNFSAIIVRNRMRERYALRGF
jgi:phosphate transport system permease protein